MPREPRKAATTTLEAEGTALSSIEPNHSINPYDGPTLNQIIQESQVRPGLPASRGRHRAAPPPRHMVNPGHRSASWLTLATYILSTWPTTSRAMVLLVVLIGGTVAVISVATAGFPWLLLLLCRYAVQRRRGNSEARYP